jgi:Fur family ferric uptake transcriptional regulator/Fur family peroxide stress response transcriptional regulator
MSMTYTEIDQGLIGKLRERSLRVTSQRLVINRAIRAQPQHMTAEQVLDRVSDTLPGTSLPTIYATLELLEELGLVRRLAASRNGAVMFDSRVEPHAHTLCRRCGAIADLDGAPVSDRALARAREAGFAADHAQLMISGLCERCAGLCGLADHSVSRAS